MRPSSSSLRFLLGLVMAAVAPFVFARFIDGPASMTSSSGADRLRVAGRGVDGFNFRGGFGSGEGSINAGALTGWLGLSIGPLVNRGSQHSS